jgi:hypothetical protein
MIFKIPPRSKGWLYSKSHLSFSTVTLLSLTSPLTHLAAKAVSTYRIIETKKHSHHSFTGRVNPEKTAFYLKDTK